MFGRPSIAAASAALLCACALLSGCDKASGRSTAATGPTATPAPAADPPPPSPAVVGPNDPSPPLFSMRVDGLHPKYDCTAVKPQVAPAGSPPDDLLGVRLGMSPIAAQAVLACGNPGYVFEHNEGGSFDLPAIEHGPLPLTDVGAQADGDRVEAMLIGLPGHEQVVRIARQRRYPSGNLPSFDAVTKGLLDKYGPPTSDSGLRLESRMMQWIHEPSGAPMNPHNPHYVNCAGIGGVGSNFSIVPDCGLTIVANLTAGADGGVVQLDLAVMNQARADAAVDREKKDIAIINRPTGSAGPM